MNNIHINNPNSLLKLKVYKNLAKEESSFYLNVNLLIKL